MKPNPNLWSVKYSHVVKGTWDRTETKYDEVWVLAASVRGAERKAMSLARGRGHRRIAMDRIKHKVAIDAF